MSQASPVSYSDNKKCPKTQILGQLTQFAMNTTTYRYTLEKGSKKHYCPNCEQKKYVRYVHQQTGDYLPLKYGKCDRDDSCQYHVNPYKDGYGKKENNLDDYSDNWTTSPPKPLHFLPEKALRHTLKSERYADNTFLQNLLHRVAFPFEVFDIERVVSLYYLGTVMNGNIKHKSTGNYQTAKGAVTFPYIDEKRRVHAIQVKQFDKTNHTIGTTSINALTLSLLKKQRKTIPKWLTDYQASKEAIGVFNCLFGAHLLNNYPNNPIALVEAPKTAIYGTLYFGFPEEPSNYLWLAVYNLSSLKFEKIRALQGRRVTLFPDLSASGKAFQLWSERAKEFEKRLIRTSFNVSSFLEEKATATQKQNGLDLADFLIKHNWRTFRKEEQPKRQLIQPQFNKARPKVKQLALLTSKYPHFKSLVERLGLEVCG